MKPILVTCYVEPDLDGVAGVIAYAELLSKQGRPAIAGVIGAPHDEAKYVLDRFHISYPLTLINTDDYEEVILVDASDLNGLEGKIAPDKVIEIIDHRKVHEAEKFPKASVQIELVGAAATLVAEKYQKTGIAISQSAAILVYNAIISNTLNFKGSVTTERDIAIAKWLRPIAGLPEDFWQELFAAKSDLTGDKLAQRIAGDLAWFNMSGKKVGIAQLEIIGAAELIVNRLAEIETELDKIKIENSFDFLFLNLVSLADEGNYLIAVDQDMQDLLMAIFDIRFVGSVAQRPGLILRKQIVPLLKEKLIDA